MPRKNTRNTRGRIISAAWKLFYEQGYEDTTVEDIVFESETSKGSFYHYFDGKDALLGTLAYVFDEKYEETIKQELGNNAKDTKVIFLKNEFKSLSLKKINFDSNFDGFDERQTFNILHKYFVDKYNLGTSKKNNKTNLEANGYNFKNTIESSIVQGKVVRLDEIQDANRIKVESIVNTNKKEFL